MNLHHPQRLVFLLLIATGLLTACAPATNSAPTPRATAAITPDAPSYYPHQTGLTWTYLTEGESILAPPYTLSVIGPSVTEGQRVTLTRLRGRAIDITYYHQHDNTGVHLLREDRTGYRITYDPPMQELPRENSLAPGVTWGGRTTATITYDDPNEPTKKQEINYRYTVLEQRPATLPAGELDTYTIEIMARDEATNLETRQHAWFSPHVGYARYRGDLILTGSNTLPNTAPAH